MRLGDTLIRLGYCSAAQVHEGLAAQVVYGARLGTNLIELGHLDLDRLARALAKRHKMPAALAGHFERRDLLIQAKVPAELAAKLFAVPLGRLAHDAARIAVAVRDRLPEHARGELAFLLDVEPDQVVEAVAPELRLYYHLELAYQLPRPNRFLRVDRDRSGVMSVPVAPPSVEDSDVDGPVWTDAAPAAPPTGPISDVEPAALDYQTAPIVDDATGKARRRFVPELGAEPPPGPQTLARIAIRPRLSDPLLAPVADRSGEPPRGLDEVVRAIRRATTRDRVAELVLAAVRDHGADAAVLLVVRQQIAIGWKGFCGADGTAIESLALALGGGGAVATAFRERQVAAVTIDLDPDPVDAAMGSLLGGPTPTWSCAAPISVGDHVVCILYAHGAVASDEAPGPRLAALAEAAGVAFGRLVRAAQR